MYHSGACLISWPMCLQGTEETRVANVTALMQHGLLDRLLSLAVAGGGVASSPVRIQVWLST